MKTTAANPGLEEVAKSDPLIRDYCRSLLHRLGNDSEQQVKDKDNLRTKLRTVAKLLKTLNDDTTRWQSLAHFIIGPCFDQIISTTKDLAAQADSPSIAIHLGFAIKQLALLKLSNGIKKGDPLMELEARMQVIERKGKSTRGLRKVYVILDISMVKAINYIITNGKRNPEEYLFRTS